MATYIQQLIINHLEVIKTEMVQRMSAMGRTASGRSVQSLEVQPFGNDGARIVGLKSWWAMERGRRGGRVPYNFQEIIRKWIIAKGIQITPIPYVRPKAGKGFSPYERGLRRASSAIAHTIMTSGTRLHRNNGFDDIYSSIMERELAKMDKELQTYMEREVKTITRTLADGTIKNFTT